MVALVSITWYYVRRFLMRRVMAKKFFFASSNRNIPFRGKNWLFRETDARQGTGFLRPLTRILQISSTPHVQCPDLQTIQNKTMEAVRISVRQGV